MSAKKGGELSNKSIVISIITVAVIVVLVGFLLLRPAGPLAGQAYRPGAAVQEADVSTAKTVYFERADGFAAQSDTVTIPLLIKAALGPDEKDIRVITYCLNYDFDKFEVTNLQITLANYNPLKGLSDVLAILNQPKATGDTDCPEGFTDNIDISVAANALNTAIAAGTTLGQITFRVDTTELSTSGAENIQIATTYIGGATQSGVPATYDDFTVKTSSTSLTIVPPCPSADGDDFPPNVAFVAFDTAADYRACLSYNALTNAIEPAFDCDDSRSTVFPGASEVCDGLDNNCNNAVDDGSYGVNDVQRGICAGNKVCLGEFGVSGAVNTYHVPDSSAAANGIQATVKTTEPYRSATNFFQGAVEKFAFEEFESTTESKCDGLDNDCDGDIDESLTDCVIGETSIVGAPPGNIYVDYGIDSPFSILDPQNLNVNDVFLVERVLATIEELGTTCGGSAQEPCFITDGVGGVPTWFCKNGVFYQYSDPDDNPATDDSQLEKRSPSGDTLEILAITPTEDNKLPGQACEE